MKKTIVQAEFSFGRYSPSTGGRGRFARIDVRCEPLLLEEGQLELVDESNLPDDFLSSVREGMEKLLKEACPDLSLRVVILRHQKHPIDSDRKAFERAGQYAISQVCLQSTQH
jgi:hypothetical protein